MLPTINDLMTSLTLDEVTDSDKGRLTICLNAAIKYVTDVVGCDDAFLLAHSDVANIAILSAAGTFWSQPISQVINGTTRASIVSIDFVFSNLITQLRAQWEVSQDDAEHQSVKADEDD